MKIEAIFAFLIFQNQAPDKHQSVTEFPKMLSTTNARFEFAGAYKKSVYSKSNNRQDNKALGRYNAERAS